MKHIIPYIAILIVLFYAMFNAYLQKHSSKPIHTVSKSYAQHVAAHAVPHIDEALSRIDTPEYTRQYITDIINHGSRSLHFKKNEMMEKGFVSKQDAPKVACYVSTLAGEKCDYSKEASLLYTSDCAGCHGNDGKGVHGSYPDLTRRPLRGIEMRKELLEHLRSRQ